MLEQIQYGRLHVVIGDDNDGKGETYTFGNKDKPASEPEATLQVKNQAAWLRLCTNLDAVGMISLAQVYKLT